MLVSNPEAAGIWLVCAEQKTCPSMPQSARLVSHKTLHAFDGVVRRDSHTFQNLNYLGGGNGTIEICRDHVNAWKPNIRIHPQRRRFRVAAYATNVTVDATFSVGR